MNLCITGALGHIGSYLIRHLSITKVKTVHLIDNLHTQRYASLFNLPKKPKFIFHQLNILNPQVEPIIKKSDVLIHLAAITDADTSHLKVKQIKNVNQGGTKFIAQLCLKHKIPLIFPSTTSVYGSQKQIVDETCKQLRPQSPYAESKISSERYLNFLGKTSQLRFIILRFGTIFGYSIGMRFHTAVNKFIWQAATGQPLTVWKTALDQKRPYLSLKDATLAINHTLENQLFNNQTYNIVTANHTVNDILQIIKQYIPQTKIKLVSSPIMNQLSYQADTSKSKTAGFIYRGNLNREIKQTISKLQNLNYLVKTTLS